MHSNRSGQLLLRFRLACALTFIEKGTPFALICPSPERKSIDRSCIDAGPRRMSSRSSAHGGHGIVPAAADPSRHLWRGRVQLYLLWEQLSCLARGSPQHLVPLGARCDCDRTHPWLGGTHARPTPRLQQVQQASRGTPLAASSEISQGERLVASRVGRERVGVPRTRVKGVKKQNIIIIVHRGASIANERRTYMHDCTGAARAPPPNPPAREQRLL